jgi:hypothetical protein
LPPRISPSRRFQTSQASRARPEIALVGIYVMNSRLDTLLTKDAAKVSDYLLQKY